MTALEGSRTAASSPEWARFALVLACAACFGSGLTVSRLGLTVLSPVTYTGLRLLVASGAFAVLSIGFRRRISNDRRLWLFAGALGVLGTALPMLSIITALRVLSGGMASIVAVSGPIFGLAFAQMALRDERLTVHKIAGCLLASCGTLWLILHRETGLRTAAGCTSCGYGLILLGLAASQGAIVLSRKYLAHYDVYDVVSAQMLAATAVLLPFVFPGLRGAPVLVGRMAVFSVLFGGLVGTVLAFVLRFHLIKQYGATDAAVVDYVVPVVATIGGALWAEERVSSAMLSGMAVIVSGVWMIQRRGGSPGARPSPERKVGS